MSPRRVARFTIPGVPRPKGSRATGFTKSGKPYSRESNPRASEWLKAAREFLGAEHSGEPLAPPYRVTATFFFEKPKKPSHPFPSRGDCDKYCRNLLDALQAGVLTNDSAVIELSAVKRWGEPRTEVLVEEVDGY